MIIKGAIKVLPEYRDEEKIEMHPQVPQKSLTDFREEPVIDFSFPVESR